MKILPSLGRYRFSKYAIIARSEKKRFIKLDYKKI